VGCLFTVVDGERRCLPLHEGKTRIGSAAHCEIVVPEVPAEVAVLIWRNQQLSLASLTYTLDVSLNETQVTWGQALVASDGDWLQLRQHRFKVCLLSEADMAALGWYGKR
jgi:hypothetical protein